MFIKLFWAPIFMLFALVALIFSAVVSTLTMLLGLAIMPFIFLIAVFSGPKEDLSHYEKDE